MTSDCDYKHNLLSICFVPDLNNKQNLVLVSHKTLKLCHKNNFESFTQFVRFNIYGYRDRTGFLVACQFVNNY